MNLLKTALTTGILLSLSMPVLASSYSRLMPGYKISPKAKKVYQNNSTTIGASRSDCENPLKGKLINLVVPEESVVHLTASNNPSFKFFSESTTNEPLIFTLINSDQTEPLVEKTLMVSEAGYQTISLPPEIKLEAGKTYIWNIAIPCSNDSESFWDVLRAGVEYVPPSPELLEKIHNVTSPEAKAKIYASESLWYDAINFVDLDRFDLQLGSRKTLFKSK